jgi:hypothetical protein
MGLICELNSSNIVINTIVVDDNDIINNGGYGSEQFTTWFKNNIRNFSENGVKYIDASQQEKQPSLNYIYDSINNVFYIQKPHNSWILNQNSWEWEAPIPFPSGSNTSLDQLYITNWDESNQKWYYIKDNNRYNWNTSLMNWEIS